VLLSWLLHFPALDLRITGGLRHAVVVDGIGGVAVRSLGLRAGGAVAVAVALVCLNRSIDIRPRGSAGAGRTPGRTTACGAPTGASLGKGETAQQDA